MVSLFGIPRNNMLTEPIVAYRVWRLPFSMEIIALLSCNYLHVWPFQQPIDFRSGQISSEKINTKNCIGIHAWKSMNQAVKYYSILERDDSLKYAIGQVYLWGKIAEHEDGYRAEYAYPRKIEYIDCHPSYREGIAKNLRNNYGCEVILNSIWDLC